jgi:hypothetical protein
MEPTTGIEPVNLILTKDALYQLSYVGPRWSGKRDSNPQPSAWKADALAIELFPHPEGNNGGEGRIRTSVGCANGFTARPLWPLGYLSELETLSLPGAGDGSRTRNLLITNQPLYR